MTLPSLLSRVEAAAGPDLDTLIVGLLGDVERHIIRTQSQTHGQLSDNQIALALLSAILRARIAEGAE